MVSVRVINGYIMTLLVVALAVGLLAIGSPATAGPYFNSSEPGCNGSDPNVLMCDDFESGVWYSTDGDHQIPENKGWGGTIYANPITPPGAVRCGPGVTPFGNCAADGGMHSGQGGRNMAQHRLKVGSCGTTGGELCGVDEIYVRVYQKWDAGYSFGAEKNITITNSDGDIAFANIALNCATGSASSTAYLGINTIYGSINEPGNCGPQNQGNNITIQSGRWYFFEFHVRAGSNALIELWVNDCGVDGKSCGSAPILRTRLTGTLPGNSNGSQIETLWLENWANPASSGNGPLRDQLKVTKAGPIGFAGNSGSIADLTAPAAPGSPTIR
jgi:hypothetical protein